jgi:asparagine synthase (glutamine-hydrolysing)
MCAISGFNFEDPALIGAMNDAQAHRGPDHGAVFHDERVSLGHRRLSVLDLSAAGHQPMSDEHGVWVSYNGEVYNFRELRAELEQGGARFRSQSDTEVLLHGWSAWGYGLFERLNGMFALAIYDRAAGRLVLARDPHGIKPLYYHWDGKRFLFASEIKGLLCHGVPRDVDAEALSEYLTFRFVLAPRTLLAAVRKLLPGHALTLDVATGRLGEPAPFAMPAFETVDTTDVEALARRLRELVVDAVRIRLVSDVPLGFFLSGGIDSTVVVAAARELGAEVRAFSAGFDTTNELPFARLAAERFAHSFREIHIGDDSLELLDDVVWHADEPVGDAAFLAVYVLSREASREVKVVLAGEGADELLAGYGRYKAMVYGQRLSHFAPRPLLRELSRRVNGNLGRLSAIVGAGDPVARYLEVIRLFTSGELAAFGVPEARAAMASRADARRFAEDPLGAAQSFDEATVLPDDFFLKADKMTSAFGLEMRVPFLDPRVVQFCRSLPPSAKLRGFSEKDLLKRAFKDALPETIVRRRKHGFNVPMDLWLRGRAGDRLRDMLLEKRHGLYDPTPALALLARFRQAGERGYRAAYHDAQKLWSLLVLEIWHRRFVTG